MKKGTESFLHWLPKILTILFCIFLTLFSLDVFDNNPTFWQVVAGLLMHNIPVFVLIIILVFAWKRPIVGAIAFWFLAALYIVWAIAARQQGWWAVNPVSLGAILIGVLFWISHKRSKYYWANRNKPTI